MKTVLTIDDFDPRLEAALAERAQAEGKPMAEIAKAILSDALDPRPKPSNEAWKRANEEAIAAYNRRFDTVLEKVHALSAAPIPQFKADQ